jgi:DNA-binding NarL/FixJ family response regulator
MLKAFILDNQAVARNLLGSVLTMGGHEVVGDSNTNLSNLARMVRLQPQIVCIDIGEANQEGLSTLTRLRQELPKALIFLVSAKIDAETIQSTQQCGVNGYIVKPFNGVAVLASIRNTIIRIATQKKTQATDADGSSDNDPSEPPAANQV